MSRDDRRGNACGDKVEAGRAVWQRRYHETAIGQVVGQHVLSGRGFILDDEYLLKVGGVASEARTADPAPQRHVIEG